MSNLVTADSRIGARQASRSLWRFVSTLLGTVERGKLRLFAAIILAVCATAASVALMGVSAWLLSRAAEMPPVMFLTAGAVGVRFFGVSRGAFRYLERLVSHGLALRMQETLRLRVYDKLSRSTLLGRRRGDLLVRVTADVEGIMDVLVRVVLPFCSACVVLVGTSLILTIFSPLFAVILLCLSIISGIILPWLGGRWTHNADDAAAPQRGELGNQVREFVRSATDLVAFDADLSALAKINATDAKLSETEGKGAWTQGIIGGLQLVITGLTTAAALIIGAHQIAEGQMLARDLAVIALVPMALGETFQDLTKAAQTLTHAKAALMRVLSILEAENIGHGDRVVDPQADATSTKLELRDVTVGWPGEPALLTGVNLIVNPGEKIAITGSSGVGKTSLAATILGLINPQAGTIQAPTNISYLAQDAHIFATTLAQNVKIGNKDASDEQVASALHRAGLDLDPDRLVGESGATLSGGEVQRLALARILARSQPSPLVILDEPTEHLDQETAEHLLDDLFRELAGSSLFVITHDRDLVARCDREITVESWASVSIQTTR